MAQLKVTLKVLYEKEDNYKYPTFKVNFVTSCGVVINISIDEPYLFENSRWRRLANGKNIMFFSSNAEVTIVCDTQFVYFNVANYGGGGDGKISVKVPHSDIKEILSEMADEIEKYKKEYE